ncbi:TPA: phage tail protein [Klebsiella quasipneumoniae subsp. similipneumoniae]|nr:phage tail protein [Klebsiella quasipneumoniae subsp. similipneumoniae]HBR1729527.1 phage tail protein [Klebsiella quasipneumoniae subsp. similipneumoniae]
MSQSVITNAFSPWLAARLADSKPARPDRMVFAWIEGQDENAEINPDEQLPAKSHITHTADIVHFGTLNERAFVCSVVLDTTVGNWRYNWIGLVDSESDTLLMIVHTAEQQKIKTAAGIQGNTLSRNLMMEFSGAAAASQITVTAETWQIDYSARLHSMDEAGRLALVDYYGQAAFRDDGFLVTVQDNVAVVEPGLGYVSGLRVELSESRSFAVANGSGVWVDAVWSGTVTGVWVHSFKVVAAVNLSDYIDSAGFQHYVTRIASVTASGVKDLRTPFPLQKLEQTIDELDVYSKTEADERFLQAENNLSDVADAGKARKSLDVHSKTEADERFLQAENNLSDITDAEEARSNLGLADIEDAGFRAIIDAVFWVGRTVISDSNPQSRYSWQTWKDLSADYNGRVLRVSTESGATGGKNKVKIEADNLPPHWHRSGDRSPGATWDPTTTHGTDNQKSGPLALTEGTYVDAAGQTESTNKEVDVTNEYVTVRAWRRTA